MNDTVFIHTLYIYIYIYMYRYHNYIYYILWDAAACIVFKRDIAFPFCVGCCCNIFCFFSPQFHLELFHFCLLTNFVLFFSSSFPHQQPAGHLSSKLEHIFTEEEPDMTSRTLFKRIRPLLQNKHNKHALSLTTSAAPTGPLSGIRY
jgi:hypothetical protein